MGQQLRENTIFLCFLMLYGSILPRSFVIIINPLSTAVFGLVEIDQTVSLNRISLLTLDKNNQKQKQVESPYT